MAYPANFGGYQKTATFAAQGAILERKRGVSEASHLKGAEKV
jgi:hypothetical protein